MTIKRFSPKAANGAITMTSGTGALAIVLSDHEMGPEINAEYGVQVTLQEVLAGTPTLVYFYITAKGVNGFTINLVATGANDTDYDLSWVLVRGKNKN
ncbi:hypothetical protein LCGC14_0821790 [marine sediment metagenome]|uniref:Uncharacterized protein n=1 Tax=marine sediment metagenome TaxID=412755 RepID=A0A0F9S3E3_9ZZZZ